MDDPDQGSDILGLPAADVIDIDTALPKTTQVYEIMRRAIASLALQPGSMVIEKLICEQLGISRTPLRDADAAAHAMKVHLDRTFTMVRRHIVERRDHFAANASDSVDAYVEAR